MPSGKFRAISISETTYEKLKELAEKRGLSISKTIEQIVLGIEPQVIDTNAIKRIVNEVFSEKMKELESMLYNVVKKALLETTKPQERKKSFIEIVREAFLGNREPITLKKLPIQISKGNIFVEGVDKLNIDLSKFKAKIVEEPNEKGEIVGVSIVPDIGFECMSLEDWFDEYGVEIIKTLSSILKGNQ